MNYFLLKDLSEGEVDAIIITKASKEEVEENIATAKEKDDYTYEDLLKCMPEGTEVVDCFKKDNILYY